MSNLGQYVLLSGLIINLRLIQKEDAKLLVDLFHHLTPETIRLRFHLNTENVSDELVWQQAVALADLDPGRQVGIIATMTEAGGQERALGVARFARASSQDTEAEGAIVIRDDFQRKGLGKFLFVLLADEARALGITHFVGWITPDNLQIMKFVEKLTTNEIETEIQHGQRKIRVAI